MFTVMITVKFIIYRNKCTQDDFAEVFKYLDL